ncbi:conserved hypothetical protein [Nitrosococcus halophilus Nc 4]|uniref:Uncharacterized protein n=1 Tax=Nitrosococcus halophilus (strain Nc4) TaxID=472759 RepID=D5C2B1_NITHN|nr:membrane protein [Nitrosococcus halophilus]ADE14770.1 conserved hypothetical protein [Nitrosococcus halophilus Nc 4]
MFTILLMGAFAVGSTVYAATDSESYFSPEPPAWISEDADGSPQVHLYFFWSLQCPHCRQAQPFIEKLGEIYPWLIVHSLELSQHPQYGQLFLEMSLPMGGRARSIPAVFICGEMIVGYDREETTGEYLRERSFQCYQRALESQLWIPANENANPHMPSLVIPIVGKIDPVTVSLPLLTLLIASIDAFNPCAFFVLLFLLSLLVHVRSRARMALVGGIFVFFSGLVYFLLMATWLNIFLLIGELQWVTLIAGLIAVLVALLNIKDFFFWGRGPSLSIPQGAKPSLFQRMGQLVRAGSSIPALLAGTVVLAVVANSYELLCTSGFPMVFTRILTLKELPAGTYYLFLVLYNIVYIIPLVLIVLTFTLTLGSRKLTEEQGRILKLLSGLMMLLLGLVLVIAPYALDNLIIAASLIGAALLLTGIFVALKRTWLKHRRIT